MAALSTRQMSALQIIFAALLTCRTAIIDARKLPARPQVCTQTAHVRSPLTAALAETSAADALLALRANRRAYLCL